MSRPYRSQPLISESTLFRTTAATVFTTFVTTSEKSLRPSKATNGSAYDSICIF